MRALKIALLLLSFQNTTAKLRPLSFDPLLPHNHITDLIQRISQTFCTIRYLDQHNYNERAISQSMFNLIGEVYILRYKIQRELLRDEDLSYLADLIDSTALEFDKLELPENNETRFIKKLFRLIDEELKILLS